ncbi:MAG TPA: PAS domain S-box protein, partial [Spirochaetia bacterium]|nr:PAS domain S-box protein [Spirochaetia bacterium]
MQSERSSGRTILLVEDEAIISLAQGATLEKYGFAVLKALSGEQAIEAVSGNPNIDLVLMDIDLGKGIDGTEAATQILAFRDLPIVFLTSHSEREMVDKVRDITRYGYVLKSTGEFVLIQAIEMAFELFESHERAAASRDRYRSVVRLTEEIILRYDADNRCVFANDRAVDFYGVPIAELMGSDPESFMDPDQFDVPRDAIAEMKRTSGPVWGSLTRELTPTGWRIVEWNSAPIVDRAGAYAGFQATGRDITERELAERDLQIMGMALESAADGVVVADFDGVITYTNAAARAMWGYDEPDAVLDRPIDDFVADPDTVRSLFREAIEQGRTHGEFVARRADGTTFDAALTASQVSPQEGLPPRIVGSVLDVSKRKETEALLSTYRQAADSAEDMIVAVDRSGRYTFANRSFLDRHKLRIREAIGRTAWEVLGSDLVEETLREKVDACLDGEVVTFEMLRQVPSQGARWMSISYSPIRMHGSVIGALGILKDITDYKETQTRLTEQLVRSERLREIARETLAGAPAQQIIANTVRQLGHHFAELRVTYSTLDRDRILSIRASAQPSAMTDLTGFEVDLSEAAEYAQALRDGIPVVVADVRQSESLAPLREKIEASEVRALLDMPVVRSDRLVGVLGFGSPTPREWTDHETETLREIAHYLTLALEARADQKKLARKTREWETLFELIPDMLCVASPDGWFLRLNRAWEGTLGFTREELKSRPVLDFVHPDDAASTVREIERQDAGEHTFNFTNRYRTKYGEYRWLEWWASPVIDGQMYATARDITGRRDQEERIAGLLAER